MVREVARSSSRYATVPTQKPSTIRKSERASAPPLPSPPQLFATIGPSSAPTPVHR